MDRKKKKVATQASTQDGDAPLGVPCLRFTTVKELQAWIEYELSKVILYQLRTLDFGIFGKTLSVAHSGLII